MITREVREVLLPGDNRNFRSVYETKDLTKPVEIPIGNSNFLTSS